MANLLCCLIIQRLLQIPLSVAFEKIRAACILSHKTCACLSGRTSSYLVTPSEPSEREKLLLTGSGIAMAFGPMFWVLRAASLSNIVMISDPPTTGVFMVGRQLVVMDPQFAIVANKSGRKASHERQ